MTESIFKVLDASNQQDAEIWLELWSQWPRREVYAHPEYLKLYHNDLSKGFCAVFSSNNGHVLYPFMLRDIGKEPYGSIGVSPLYDIITPYGYGGPFAWGFENKEAPGHIFWEHFRNWVLENNIVSEVVKFSVFGENLAPYEGAKKEVMRNIVVDLTAPEDDLWMRFEHKVRKNVKKAARAGVSVVTDSMGAGLSDFLTIYRSTLDRRNAKENYYFTSDYFKSLHCNLPGEFMYFHALHDGKPVSTELVLVSSESVYSFLGGTYSDKFNLAPNDMLKHEIIKWGVKNHKKYFVLGGGYEPDDGIYRYKKSFAPAGSVPFFVGSRVFNGALYDKLIQRRKVAEREKGNDWDPIPDFVPEYRS